jgi:hypothetical protein
VRAFGRSWCRRGFRPNDLLELVADVPQVALLMTLGAGDLRTADVGVSVGKTAMLALSTLIVGALSKVFDIRLAEIS